MKRRMLALLLAVLMLAMLTAAAFAEDTVLGVYNVTGPLTVLNGTKNGSFYADANEFELNCSGLTGEYSLVLLLEGDSPVPTDGNIQYIDQMSVEGGKVTIPVVRKKEVVNTTSTSARPTRRSRRSHRSSTARSRMSFWAMWMAMERLKRLTHCWCCSMYQKQLHWKETSLWLLTLTRMA